MLNSLSPSNLSKLEFYLEKTSFKRLALQKWFTPSRKRSLYMLQTRDCTPCMLQGRRGWCITLQGKRRHLDIPHRKAISHTNKSSPPMLQEDHQLVIFVTRRDTSKQRCKWKTLVQEGKEKWIPKKAKAKRGMESFLNP